MFDLLLLSNMTFRINAFYVGSKPEDTSDEASYIPCSALFVQCLFSCSRFDVILLSVLKEIAVGVCLLWIVSLLSLY